MRASNRLKRIAKVMKEKQLSQRRWRYIVCNFGESEEDAIARSGYDPEDNFVLIVKFSDENTWPEHGKNLLKYETPAPETTQDIDVEISELKNQLREEHGLSDQQIDDLLLEVEPCEPMT